MGQPARRFESELYRAHSDVLHGGDLHLDQTVGRQLAMLVAHVNHLLRPYDLELDTLVHRAEAGFDDSQLDELYAFFAGTDVDDCIARAAAFRFEIAPLRGEPLFDKAIRLLLEARSDFAEHDVSTGDKSLDPCGSGIN